LCPQTFIVKIRMPVSGCISTFYSRTERRGNRLVARETERESVCATLRCLKMQLASVVKRVAMRTCTLKLFVSETI